ncbi:hypothetical protein CF65_02605 [Aggregatibacter actinomycetemcomitans HK1651]|nr:hypothetical protein CF65_02605 [Aggregatibacter actinomycetemcomitans HK1651]
MGFKARLMFFLSFVKNRNLWTNPVKSICNNGYARSKSQLKNI